MHRVRVFVCRFRDPANCIKAAAALHNTPMGGSSSCSTTRFRAPYRDPCLYRVQLQSSMTMLVDGRTLRAVRPQLQQAIADAQQQLPGVSVQMLERSQPSNAAPKTSQTSSSSRCTAGASSGGCSSLAAALLAPVTEALVRITGSDQQQVLAARRLFEPVLAGRVFAGGGGMQTWLRCSLQPARHSC